MLSLGLVLRASDLSMRPRFMDWLALGCYYFSS